MCVKDKDGKPNQFKYVYLDLGYREVRIEALGDWGVCSCLCCDLDPTQGWAGDALR